LKFGCPVNILAVAREHAAHSGFKDLETACPAPGWYIVLLALVAKALAQGSFPSPRLDHALIFLPPQGC
jgi:hypothetical protein